MGLWCLLLSNDNYLLNILSQPNQPQLNILSQPKQPQLNILSQPNQPQHDILSQPKIRILPPPDKDFDKQRNGWDISPLCGIFELWLKFCVFELKCLEEFHISN